MKRIILTVILALVLMTAPAAAQSPIMLDASQGVVRLILQQENIGSYELSMQGDFESVTIVPGDFITFYNILPDRVLIAGFMSSEPLSPGELLSAEFTGNFIRVTGWVYDPDGNAYPVDTNVTVYVQGDANSDGVVNIRDAMAVAEYTVGKSVEIDLEAADMTGDGVVTIVDAMYIAQYCVGVR